MTSGASCAVGSFASPAGNSGASATSAQPDSCTRDAALDQCVSVFSEVGVARLAARGTICCLDAVKGVPRSVLSLAVVLALTALLLELGLALSPSAGRAGGLASDPDWGHRRPPHRVSRDRNKRSAGSTTVGSDRRAAPGGGIRWRLLHLWRAAVHRVSSPSRRGPDGRAHTFRVVDPGVPARARRNTWL